VHDSLWRIAERCLGDGARWPEIWALNKNTAQIDGRMFATPNLIYPGWELQLPAPTTNKPDLPIDEPPAPPDMPNTESPGHDPDEQPHGPDSQPPSGQLVPSEPAEPAHPESAAPPGISTPTGAFVGIGLAALITVALMTVRLHRRRRYRPGTSTLDDPGRAPVVRALRIAHDVTMSLDDDTPRTPTPPDATRLPDLETRDRAQVTALAVQPARDETALGVRSGQTVALNVARSRGLGLIGLGAHAAARALLVSVLARTATTDGQVVIPAADARTLFGADLPARSTTRLRVLDNLATALDVLETELLIRARRAAASASRNDQSPLVLVATPSEDTARRTQAILDNGSGFNVAGILLGQWRAGGTVRVRDDGTVSATSPNLADQLSGARLFTLPSTDAADLLALLSDADSTREPTTTADEEPVKATADHYDFVLAEQADGSEQKPVAAVVEHRLAPPVPDDVRVSAIDAPLLSFQVLGRLHLTHTGANPADVIDAIAPRQREILVYLALHGAGCRRESLTTALWPDAPGDRPYNSFHATLSQLRRALRKATNDAIPNLVVNDDNHYQLNTSLVTVDLWQLQDALTTCRHASAPPERLAAIQRITELYRGDLATGIAADWIDPAREALRREVLEALSATIRAVDDDPEQMLMWLEKARGMDPYNEAIYRDLMRVQARLGQYDSIPRTLSLLTTSLAELDQRPTRDTLGLADFLQRMPARRPPAREAS
jgi:DNA-binding SARP family transcriptional activator